MLAPGLGGEGAHANTSIESVFAMFAMFAYPERPERREQNVRHVRLVRLRVRLLEKHLQKCLRPRTRPALKTDERHNTLLELFNRLRVLRFEMQ